MQVVSPPRFLLPPNLGLALRFPSGAVLELCMKMLSYFFSVFVMQVPGERGIRVSAALLHF